MSIPSKKKFVIPKLCGADVEFGNFILGGHGNQAPWMAASSVLAEIPGISSASHGTGCSSYDSGFSPAPSRKTSYLYSQDWARKFLPANGGCAYIDLQHLEMCLPEVRSAYDFVAAWQGTLLIVQEALARANAANADGGKIYILANNSDGLGNSYGSHLNFLVTRPCWNNIFNYKMQQALFLASYFVSSILITGAGKVGSENGRPDVDYQLSQRADFFETLTGIQTTYNRPIVNCRDESLSGSSSFCREHESLDDRLARLHVIFFDNTLCPVSNFLKVGVTQIILAMIEQEAVDISLILDDPISALIAWSHDSSLQVRKRMITGKEYTALDLQWAFYEKARAFVEKGRTKNIVPCGEEILRQWETVLQQLSERDFRGLLRKLDWVLKKSILERAVATRGLDWKAPEIKHLDHVYSSLDPNEGLYWVYQKAGMLEELVGRDQIERSVYEPPEDTRAWLRAKILRVVNSQVIDAIDWDAIRFCIPVSKRGNWVSVKYYTLPMPDPLGGTCRQCQPLFEKKENIAKVLKALGLKEDSVREQYIYTEQLG